MKRKLIGKILASMVIAIVCITLVIQIIQKPTNFTPSDGYKIYANEKYGFSIAYPTDRTPIESNNGATVNFVSKNSDPWNEEIKISTTSLTQANKPLANEPYQVIEKNIQIGGQNALVMYEHDPTEGDIKDEKMAYFIRNGLLYRIYTRYIDHEAIWNSFRFLN